MTENGLPQNWNYQSIGELCDLINGRAFKPTEWSKEGLPIVRIQNLNDETKPFNYFNGKAAEKNLINNGDVLLSWSGTPGTSFGCFYWNGGEAVLNQHIFKVVVDEQKCDKEFFIFAVNNILDEMIAQAHGGVGLRHITKAKLEQLNLAIAPLEEQQRIVGRIKECLSRVDEIKHLREESRKETSNLLAATIEDYFKDAGGEDVELGEVVTIESTLIDPRHNEFLDLPHVGGANIFSGTGELINIKTAREENLISGKFIFDSSNVVYSKIRPYLRKVFRPNFRGLCSADIYPLKPNLERISPDFLFYLLLSRDFTNYAIASSNRAGMPKVNRTQMFAYKFKLPPLNVQKLIATRLDEAKETALALVTEFENTDVELGQVTNSVLRKAFAGEL